MAATCQQHLNRCRPVETERILTGTLDRKCQGLTEFRSEPLREGPHARVGKKDSMSNSSNVITKSDSDLAVREQGLFIGSLIPPKPVGRAPPGRIFTVDSCVIENMTRQQHIEVVACFAQNPRTVPNFSKNILAPESRHEGAEI